MKKTMIVCLTAFSLAGCVSNNNIETPEQIKQNAEAFAQELEASKDPIKVMDAYLKYFNSNVHDVLFNCSYGYGGLTCPGRKVADSCERVDKSTYNPKNCEFAYALAEPGTKYDCSGWSQSDECILYRRHRHETKVAYFDYKRFLGSDTRIKDDITFLHFANAYAKNVGCETRKETTSLEKQGCKERSNNIFRKAIKENVHCRDLVEFAYKEWLEEEAPRTYEWYRETCKDTHAYALEKVGEKAANFAKTYVCDMSGWQKEFLK